MIVHLFRDATQAKQNQQLVTQMFNAMLEMGMRELDNSAVIGVIEALANQKLL